MGKRALVSLGHRDYNAGKEFRDPALMRYLDDHGCPRPMHYEVKVLDY